MHVRLQVLAALGLAGCGTELVQPEAPINCDLGGRTLSLSHEQLAFGGEAKIDVTGANPGETVAFWWTGIEEPTCTCSDEISGCLELDLPEPLGSAVADESGYASVTIEIGPDELVGPRSIQASSAGGVSAVIVGQVSANLGSYLTEQDAQYAVAGSGLGEVVVGVGDVDGDGRAEVAAGAPDLGAVHIYTAADATRGSSGALHLVDRLSGVVTLLGPPGAGRAVSAAGDVNADGHADLMVSAPDEGSVWLVHGGLAPGVHDLASVASDTLSAPGIGASLATADLDGDKRPDLVIAAEDRLLLSFDSDLDPDEEILDLVQPKVANAGDLDGDGLQDLVIASGDEVLLYYGPGIVEGGLDMPGAQISAVGDLNGDGYDDVQAAAPEVLGERGVVSTVHGPISPLSTVLEGAATGDRVGEALSGAGDIDGDGFDDLVASSAGGTALLLYGPAEGTRSTTDADIRIESSTPGWTLATALAGPGDLDGDAVDDLIVGATTRGAHGALHVFRGAPGW